MTKISIVTSLYKSEKYIEEFASKIINVTKKMGVDYEIIFVNDCCPQNSLVVALKIAHKYENIKVIDLAVNSNHHKAIMTGLKHSSGDYIFTLDVDLEEKPELLEEFFKKISDNKNLDLVYGRQEKRVGKNLARGFLTNIFYHIFGFLTDYKIQNQSMIRLMTKRFVDNLVKFHEYDVFLYGITSLNGFESDFIICHKPYKGSTSYTLSKRVKLAINAITSFSSKPLILISCFGILVSFISFIFGTYIMLKKIFLGSVISGWSSIMVSIWMVGGMIIFCLGIIAIYIAKIFIESKKRPYVVIRDKYGFGDSKE